MSENKFIPRLIAWEITRKCHLACKHCRASATCLDYSGELTTHESFKLLENIASFKEQIIIILTGGEPMSRDDVYDIAEYGNNLGLKMVMAPCGQLITDETAGKIKHSGIKRLSFSIDGANRETHDSFRGVSGAFDSTLRGIEICREHGIEFQINTTVTKLNIHELPDILELAIRIGAAAFHPFLLVPTGRGIALADLELSSDEYEQTLKWILQKSSEVELFFKPTCAPHYHRIIRQNADIVRPKETEKHSSDSFKKSHPHSKGMESLSRGCMGGVSFAFISHVGDVQICGFLPLNCGNVRESSFTTIWDTSDVFNKLRDYSNLKGKCGVCEFVKVCGGCRARAYAISGDYLGEEPFCNYIPRGWCDRSE